MRLPESFVPCGEPCWLCGEDIPCVLPEGHQGPHTGYYDPEDGEA